MTLWETFKHIKYEDFMHHRRVTQHNALLPALAADTDMAVSAIANSQPTPTEPFKHEMSEEFLHRRYVTQRDALVPALAADTNMAQGAITNFL